MQRCLSASVTVDATVVSSIGKGILILAAIGPTDTHQTVESMATKILKMRLWPDESERQWKQDVRDIQGEVLCVSQFTLYGSTKKGNKPDFHGAAKPEVAKELYDHFVSKIKQSYEETKVKDGIFQAMMQVALVNDGPVTLQMDNDDPKKTAGVSGVSTPNITDDTSSTTSASRQKDNIGSTLR